MSESRSRTSFSQSGIGHLRKLPQRLKEFGPFRAQRRHLLLPARGEPITAPASAGFANLPFAAHPALLLHPVKQRIQRSQREAQLTLCLLLNTASDLVTVQCARLQYTQNRQFRSAPFYSRSDHIKEPYI